ncbi:DUF2070 family protein [Halorubrum gandharaense]
MTANQGRLAELSRFVFRAPRWPRTLAFAVLLAGLTGIAVFDAAATMESPYRVLLLGQDAWQGLFFIGIPTVVAALATTTVDGALGGDLTYNRSALLALCCEVLVVAILVAAAVVTAVTALGQAFVFDALVVALAAIFAVRLLVVLAVSRLSLLRACLPASIQSGVAALLLFVYSGTVQLLTEGGSPYDAYITWLARGEAGPPAFEAVAADHFLLLGALSMLNALAVWAFLVGIERPWRRSLGVSVLDFVRGFIGHVADGSRDLERFFEKLGQEAVVPVSVLSFRPVVDGEGANTDGDAEFDDSAFGPEKARVVLPMVHPGPMGDIGGGNLPVRAAQRSEGLAFVPHATAGHDFNLVSGREVERLLDAADRAHDRIAFDREATTPVVEHAGEATMLGQAFGGTALAVNTFAPNSADDVNFAVGQSARAELRAGGFDDVLLADAHNCNEGLGGPDLGHVTPGSRRSYDLFAAAEQTGDALAAADRGPLELGIAHDPTNWTPAEGIGPLGIRVAVTRAAGERAAYVVIDGNNVVPGLRSTLLDAVRDHTGIEHAEVLTTDTHVVNRTTADNRVGEEIDHGALADLVGNLVMEADADREPVVAGGATEHATAVVFGNDRTETLAAQANAAVSLGGALAAAVTLLVTVVSLVLVFAT